MTLGRWYSERDLRLINSINAELFSDMLQIVVILFKIAPGPTETNLYGESDTKVGKIFYDGVEMVCQLVKDEIQTNQDDFGPTRIQGVTFGFQQESLELVSFFPETGDLILYNHRYHEVDNIVQEQLLGGQPEKSFSIVCHTHYSRLSKINTISRQS